MIPYTKQYKNISDLISLLKSRGLIIDNEIKARNHLANIGYFRLSAYFYPLLESPKAIHKFKEGSRFEQALSLYRFDRKLRLLIFNEIEKIEVAIRSIMVDIACQYFHDPFWITQNQYFYNQTFFSNSLAEINAESSRSKEDFIEHFKNTYNSLYPPAWTIVEILSLGNICRIYKNINDLNLKKKIAARFGLHPVVFESWIMTLSGLRNICCHHSRLWNKVLLLKTVLPQKTYFPWLNSTYTIDTQRVYFRICMIKYLLFSISPTNTFKEKLTKLLSKYPTVDIIAMGFSADWQNEPLWK